MGRQQEFHFGTVSTRDLTELGMTHHAAVVSHALWREARKSKNYPAAEGFAQDTASFLRKRQEKTNQMKSLRTEKAYGKRPKSYSGPNQFGMNLN